MKEKRVADSQTEQTYLMRPKYLNGYGKLFGGQLMGWIDEIASIVAMRHSESEITTAAIDNLNFKESASVDDVIVLRGKITHVGRTSMEVRVDTYVESRRGIRKIINRAYVVMVAVDDCQIPYRYRACWWRPRRKKPSGKAAKNAMPSANSGE